jgi:hypothetical protein
LSSSGARGGGFSGRRLGVLLLELGLSASSNAFLDVLRPIQYAFAGVGGPLIVPGAMVIYPTDEPFRGPIMCSPDAYRTGGIGPT